MDKRDITEEMDYLAEWAAKDSVTRYSISPCNIHHIHTTKLLPLNELSPFSCFVPKIVFKSNRTGGCTRFSADIEAEGGAPRETSCIGRVHHANTNDVK